MGIKLLNTQDWINTKHSSDERSKEFSRNQPSSEKVINDEG